MPLDGAILFAQSRGIPMSAPLIHTQVDHRDGGTSGSRLTLSQLPGVPWKLHFCLARHPRRELG